MQTINSVDTLRQLALSNAGIFAAMFARAPKTLTFKGKTYLRDSCTSVEKKLWYLSAAATTQPSAVRAIGKGSYSLDEVFGLDPDRSRVVDAETELRAATSAVGAAASKVAAMKRRIADAESQLRGALAAQKEAQKVQVGDIFTAGISAAGRNLYADGQVALWRDRINSLKTGSLVGMAGQDGWAIPLNKGLTQLESELTEAKAAERSARENVKAAKADYDAEARAMRQTEERERAQQAADERERQLAEAQARARDEQAAAQLAQLQTSTSQSYVEPSGVSGASDPSTWEGYYEEEAVEPDYGDEYFESEDLDDARDLFPGDEQQAQDYAEDVLGVDDAAAAALAQLSYVSPYSFDRYYGADCDGACDGHCEICDDVAALRVEMFDAGWGFDGDAYFADKLGDADEQGGSRLVPTTPPLVGAPGSSTAPFDFASVIPLILSAVLMLAPLVLRAFGAPLALEDSNPPKSTLDEVHAAQAIEQPDKPDNRVGNTVGAVGVGALLVHLLG